MGSNGVEEWVNIAELETQRGLPVTFLSPLPGLDSFALDKLSTKLPPLPGLFQIEPKKPNVLCSTPMIKIASLGIFAIIGVLVAAPGVG